MENRKSIACPAIWFSGFFGLGAVMHLIRLILRLSLVVGGHEIPLTASVLLVAVFGILSIGLLVLGCKKPCCDKE